MRSKTNQPNTTPNLKTLYRNANGLATDSVWLDDHLMYKDSTILESLDDALGVGVCNQQDSPRNHGNLHCTSQPSVAG